MLRRCENFDNLCALPQIYSDANRHELIRLERMGKPPFQERQRWHVVKTVDHATGLTILSVISDIPIPHACKPKIMGRGLPKPPSVSLNKRVQGLSLKTEA